MKITSTNIPDYVTNLLLEKFSKLFFKTSLEYSQYDFPKALKDLSGCFGNSIHPKINESLAFSLTKPKTAALCYDRVWGVSNNIPPNIRFGCINSGEIEVIASTIVNSWIRLLRRYNTDISNDLTMMEHINFIKKIIPNYESAFPKSLLPGSDILSSNITNELTQVDLDRKNISLNDNENWIYDLQNLISTSIVSTLSIMTNNDITEIFDSIYSRDYKKEPGKREVLLAILSNLSIVDEDSLTWEQVSEFRSDKNSQLKYKQLIHWLDKDLIHKSQSFIEDEISIKLNDYEWALKKHGIKYLLGELQSCIDLKALGISGGFISLSSILGEPLLGILMTSGILVSKISLKFANYKIEHNDLKRKNNPEISYVYELKKLNKSNMQ